MTYWASWSVALSGDTALVGAPDAEFEDALGMAETDGAAAVMAPCSTAAQQNWDYQW